MNVRIKHWETPTTESYPTTTRTYLISAYVKKLGVEYNCPCNKCLQETDETRHVLYRTSKYAENEVKRGRRVDAGSLRMLCTWNSSLSGGEGGRSGQGAAARAVACSVAAAGRCYTVRGGIGRRCRSVLRVERRAVTWAGSERLGLDRRRRWRLERRWWRGLERRRLERRRRRRLEQRWRRLEQRRPRLELRRRRRRLEQRRWRLERRRPRRG
jgi:hypothetical protein